MLIPKVSMNILETPHILEIIEYGNQNTCDITVHLPVTDRGSLIISKISRLIHKFTPVSVHSEVDCKTSLATFAQRSTSRR